MLLSSGTFYLLFHILSVVILLAGLFLLLFFSSSDSKQQWTIKSLLVVLLLLESTTLIIDVFEVADSNLIFLPIGQFLSLFFMIQIYTADFKKNTFLFKIIAWSIALVLLILNFLTFSEKENIQFYLDILGNLIIIGCVLISFLNETLSLQIKKGKFLLNSSVILLYSVDVILLITLNFLVNESLSWVAPVWCVRILLIQFFYVALIYYGWKVGKKTK